MAWPVVAAALCIAAVHGAEECVAPPVGSEYAHDPPSFFPTSFHEVPVLAVKQETHNTKRITFLLPEGVSLNLPVSSAIAMNAPGTGEDGKDVVRAYNPISPNSMLGQFELLVKVYSEGRASKYAGTLQPGDRVAFKQAKIGVKPWQYPFGKETITMVAGGTGIAPMIQALHPLLTTPGDTTRVRLLYGSLTPDDILLKEELDAYAAAFPDRFEVHYVVGREEWDDSARDSHGWEGEVGWVDEEKLGRLAFPPSPTTAIWVCGLDAMYVSLAGSRMKPLAPGSALHKLGYTPEMVWRS